jgi:hypothetical protein
VITNLRFSEVTHNKAAIGLGNHVSYKRRGTESGLLGMNILSTIRGWPGKKAAYEPLWLQILGERPNLPKLFSICLKDTRGVYSGHMEVGGELNDPNRGGVAPTGEEITIDQFRTQPNDWALRAELFWRPAGNNPQSDTRLDPQGGPITIILDTGAE